MVGFEGSDVGFLVGCSVGGPEGSDVGFLVVCPVVGFEWLEKMLSSVIIYVFRRPSTAMLASAVRWREDTMDSWCVKVLAGNIYGCWAMELSPDNGQGSGVNDSI